MPYDQEQVRSSLKLLGFFAVLAAMVLVPTYLSRSHTRSRIKTAHAELGVATDGGQGMTVVHNEVRLLREQDRSAQSRVPTEARVGQFLQNLSRALDEQGVVDKEVVTQSPREYARFSTISVTINFRARFDQVFRALRSMERLPRLIRVDELELVGDPQDATEPLAVTLRLSTFYAHEEDPGT